MGILNYRYNSIKLNLGRVIEPGQLNPQRRSKTEACLYRRRYLKLIQKKEAQKGGEDNEKGVYKLTGRAQLHRNRI